VKIQAVHSSDPVFVTQMETPDRIELRLGEPKPGTTRIAFLTAKQARQVAIALLQVAEAVDASK
jgi:hypothetical protein